MNLVTKEEIQLTVIMVMSILVIAGRFFVPGHALSWAGSYEAFAHIWVGALLATAYLNTGLRRPSLVWLGITTLVEIAKFLTRS